MPQNLSIQLQKHLEAATSAQNLRDLFVAVLGYVEVLTRPEYQDAVSTLVKQADEATKLHQARRTAAVDELKTECDNLFSLIPEQLLLEKLRNGYARLPQTAPDEMLPQSLFILRRRLVKLSGEADAFPIPPAYAAWLNHSKRAALNAPLEPWYSWEELYKFRAAYVDYENEMARAIESADFGAMTRIQNTYEIIEDAMGDISRGLGYHLFRKLQDHLNNCTLSLPVLKNRRHRNRVRSTDGASML